MNFHPLDPALATAVTLGKDPVKIRLELVRATGERRILPEESLLEAEFQNSIEKEFLITTRADLTLDGTIGNYPGTGEQDVSMKIYFTVGTCDHWLHRYTMTPDDRGFRRIREGKKNHTIKVTLEDIPGRLKRTEPSKDWSSEEVLIDPVFCDNNQLEKSLFHAIALKAGIPAVEITGVTVPLTIPYAKLERNIWEELADLTKGTRAYLAGGTEKKLILTDSPWGTDQVETEETEYLTLDKFYRMDEREDQGQYANEIRLRWNKPERLTEKILWTYQDPPVNYDSDLKTRYPFRVAGEKRAIENAGYEAVYKACLPDGTEVPVIHTENTSCHLIAYDGLAVTSWDNSDPLKGKIRMTCTLDGDLFSLDIEGTPIVKRENCSSYKRDEDAISEKGLVVRNVTGRYFSDSQGIRKAHYDEWTDIALAWHSRGRRSFTLYSDFPWFHCQPGAVPILTKEGEEIPVRVLSLNMKYKRRESFLTVMELLEEDE